MSIKNDFKLIAIKNTMSCTPCLPKPCLRTIQLVIAVLEPTSKLNLILNHSLMLRKIAFGSLVAST